MYKLTVVNIYYRGIAIKKNKEIRRKRIRVENEEIWEEYLPQSIHKWRLLSLTLNGDSIANDNYSLFVRYWF